MFNVLGLPIATVMCKTRFELEKDASKSLTKGIKRRQITYFDESSLIINDCDVTFKNVTELVSKQINVFPKC